MIKTGQEKNLIAELIEKQKEKGTYDSPCMSICDYDGLFKQCRTCSMRKAEKNLWKTGDLDMKGSILRAIEKRIV
ncbi:MAG: DUF1289 domain-containing protein [Bacteriovoracaceae bacterium]|jgi:predicted Fe-S protein YdhL (DUF1289 family)|nr:DUF1289 domain-containing protein [Bacteriovoracaceae bacterium]